MCMESIFGMIAMNVLSSKAENGAVKKHAARTQLAWRRFICTNTHRESVECFATTAPDKHARPVEDDDHRERRAPVELRKTRN